MGPTDTAATRHGAQAKQSNRHWPHRGGTLDDLMGTAPETAPVAAPAAAEVVARVEAVSICSSDIKVIRLGPDHPLFAATSNARPDTVLGHEVCLRVEAVGRDMAQRFRPGQRLGLQPAMRIAGERRIIGMDLPGGFAQYLRLDRRALDGAYVFDVPEGLAAAEIAMLEPYGCVERAWQPNVRTGFAPEGSVLIVQGPGSERITAGHPVGWRQATVLGPRPDWLEAEVPVKEIAALSALPPQGFDDILALGELPAAELERLIDALAPGGMLLQARQSATDRPVRIDPARIHYDALAFVGTTAPDLLEALDPARQRFEARPGAAALVLGAGGAMGRIHVHRLLQRADGPATVVATSRKGPRLHDLEADFAPLARAAGRTLIVTDDAGLDAARDAHAPEGFDDAAVIAPSVAAVERAAALVASNGLLSVFAGMPYGSSFPYDLAAVATRGARLTGSSGCSVADMQGVLARVESGELSLQANLKAVAGLDALPRALLAVTEGEISGKIVVYPHAPGMGLIPLEGPWGAAEEEGLTG